MEGLLRYFISGIYYRCIYYLFGLGLFKVFIDVCMSDISPAGLSGLSSRLEKFRN